MGAASVSGALVAGVDEAGRGALAGPLYVAAVILPADFRHPLLRDSKTLTPHQRAEMASLLREAALAYAIIEVSVGEIERYNVLRATLRGMARAVEALPLKPTLVRIDGRHTPSLQGYRIEAHVDGDAIWPEIAAASILAKTARDACMINLHSQYPNYRWDQNKGYPTIQHREALRLYGPSRHHRPSFLKKIL